MTPLCSWWGSGPLTLTQTGEGLQAAFRPADPWRGTCTLGEATQRPLASAQTPAEMNNANGNTLEGEGPGGDLPHAPELPLRPPASTAGAHEPAPPSEDVLRPYFSLFRFVK